MSSSLTWSLIVQTGLFERLSNRQELEAKRLIIELILSTDLERHFDLLARFNIRAFKLPQADMEV